MLLIVQVKTTHLYLVESTQAVVPGRHHVWKHIVQERDEPAEIKTEENYQHHVW